MCHRGAAIKQHSEEICSMMRRQGCVKSLFPKQVSPQVLPSFLRPETNVSQCFDSTARPCVLQFLRICTAAGYWNFVFSLSTPSLHEHRNSKALNFVNFQYSPSKQSSINSQCWLIFFRGNEGKGVNASVASKLKSFHRVVKLKVYTGLQSVVTHRQNASS